MRAGETVGASPSRLAAGAHARRWRDSCGRARPTNTAAIIIPITNRKIELERRLLVKVAAASSRTPITPARRPGVTSSTLGLPQPGRVAGGRCPPQTNRNNPGGFAAFNANTWRLWRASSIPIPLPTREGAQPRDDVRAFTGPAPDGRTYDSHRWAASQTRGRPTAEATIPVDQALAPLA
jgi:hypothetical protein